MNVISILITFLIAAATCSASESVIHGTWKSNGAKTLSYLTEHTKLKEQSSNNLPQIFGKAVVTFNPDGTGTFVTPPSTVTLIDGKKVELEGGTIKFTYEILGETATQIVMKSDSEEGMIKNRPFSLITLHGKDSYSVSLDDGITGLFGREFFNRIEPEND